MPPLIRPSSVDEAGDAVRQFIRAYHGSPYDFDRFDASKIGTGEGAQAYGYGLYFGGHPGTAEAYRHLPKGNVIFVDQEPVARSFQLSGVKSLEQSPHLQRAIQQELITPSEAEGILAGRPWNDYGAGMEGIHFAARHARDPARAKTLQEALRSLTSRVDVEPLGFVYDVEIGHRPSRLLDWDAPMSAQPEAIRRAYGSLAMDRPGDGGRVWRDIQTRLAEGYDEDLAGDLSSADAAQELLSEGVPGIRYWDQGSRSAKSGTRNYVIFPGAEDQIRILRKYAVPGVVGTGAAAMSGGSDD